MTVTPFNARPAPPEFMPDEAQHRRALGRSLQKVSKGVIDCTLSVTLTDGAASTTVTDVRISLQTAVVAMPTTAHAAAEIAAGTMFFTPSKGQVAISHANNAQTDRTFTFALIG